MLKKNRIIFMVTIIVFSLLFVVYNVPFPLYKKYVEETSEDTEQASQDTENSTHLKTFAEIEQLFCFPEIAPVTKRLLMNPCPRNGIVTAMQRGRLGNQMWNYASVWALARHTRLTPYVPRCLRFMLDEVFGSLSVPTLEEIAHCPVNLSAFAKDISNWSYTNQSILISPFNFEYQFVLLLAKDIVQEFSFKQEFLDDSQSILRSAVRKLQNASPVFVGVHVRRTDYIVYLLRSHRMFPANETFFLNAMQYFEEKFENVQFVFVSDDSEWCREQFAIKKNVYIASNGWNVPALDLAILAACNHTIFDYGTFGQWAAILAGGETIYYNMSNNNEHFGLLKHWHAF